MTMTAELSPGVRGVEPRELSISRDGGSWRLTCESVVGRPLDEVFEFFADARNLERLTPGLLRFEVLTPEPIEMRAGLLIDYRLRVHGVPIRWRTEIPVWEPPRRFVDRAVRSPYALWRHEHTFEEVEGGTLVRDVVEYRPKGWVLAGVLNELFVKRDLIEIFRFRTARIAELLG